MFHPPPAQSPQEQLTALMALAYQATAEPEVWATFLERLGVLFRANFTNVGLVTQPQQVWWFDDPACLVREEQDVNVVFQQGLSAAALRELAGRWVAIDGYSQPAFQIGVEQSRVLDRREITPDADFNLLPFCHEFALPHDYYHTLSTSAMSERRDLGMFVNIHRPKRYGPFDQHEATWLEQLRPHLEQALNLHQHWRALRQHTRSRTLALDTLDQPCLTVDIRGRVLWVNRAAELVLQAGDGLTVCASVLRASEPTQQAALLWALGQVSRLPSGQTLLLARRGKARPLRVTLLHVPTEERLGQDERQILLLLSDPDTERLPTARHLEQTYGLTPAEVRVAVALAKGVSIEDIAGQGQVAVGTVRNQLKQVLSKTDTHRQAALVRLPSLP